MGIVFGKTGVVEPSFEMLLSRSSASLPYEVRRYGKRFAIETEYKASNNGDGFRALAGYIGVGTKPQNEGAGKAEKIAMTAPVITSAKEGDKIAMTAPVITSSKGDKIAMTAPVVTSSDNGDEMKTMQFILPEEYDDISKIPKPTNPKVVIKEVPPATGAVHRFNGSVNNALEKKKASELAHQLIEDGVDTTEEEVLQNFDMWQFHPPFTLGPMRRNEVWVPLSEAQVDELLKKFKEEGK